MAVDVRHAFGMLVITVGWTVFSIAVMVLIFNYKNNLNHAYDQMEPRASYFEDVCKVPEVLQKYKTYAYCHELEHSQAQSPEAEAFLKTVELFKLCSILPCEFLSGKIKLFFLTVILSVFTGGYCVVQYGQYFFSRRESHIPVYGVDIGKAVKQS